MFDHHHLPTEIWLEILRWATTSDKEINLMTASYSPFRPAPNDVPDSVMAVKANVALVCREWRHLTTGFLYENLRIHHGVDALRDALRGQGGNYRLVRRVVLPYRSTVTTTYQPQPHPSIEILGHCVNLETLVRPRLLVPETLQCHFEAAQLPLISLKRLDWWYHPEAERSGGINSLSVALEGTPNLQYLSVGGAVGHRHHLNGASHLTLSKLRTLRLFGSNGLFLRGLAGLWSLPALTNVIVDFPLAQMGLSHVWEAFGAQLQRVEFGKHVRFLLDDHVADCLKGCPNLEELNFFLFFTMVPSPSQIRHASITTIRLHAAVNQLLQDGTAVCDHIENHFKVLMSDTFPSLRTIVLYGEWRGIISHPHLAPMWQSVRDRGVAIALSER
ncbi:hypothetical protein D9615_001184 [Tricholomella constricta]|uniref:F-box domain-containing protein n=1 Tax=Tricholomella constricta TaxID=117010 RepID=A0A8H5HKK1_9AGAR|nr:hypothetical protein D9615_001184 [Tricholomella constricta]